MLILKKYLDTLTYAEKHDYAKRAGTSYGYLYRLISICKKQMVKIDGALARKLDEESGGAVCRHILRPDIFDPPATNKEG